MSARRPPSVSSTASKSPQTISAAEILAPLQPSMQKLEAFLEKQCDIFEPGVSACVRYVATNQGKRLRPALVIFSANAQNGQAVGTVDDELLKMCAIVELVHIATLVHDDIMDGAELRRNRLTAATKWGHEVSVLLGDCLFAHALSLAASYPTPFVCRRVADATNIVCAGEILQTQRRFDLKLKEAEYLKMLEMKTGALFAVSCELGAFLSGADPDRCKKFYEFGRLLGIAYQIYDDCLDLVGAEKEIGKSLGTDLQKGKLTLPIILLLEQAEASESHLISSILLNEHANSSGMLLEFIKRYKTLPQSIQKAQTLLQAAANEIKDLSDNDGKRLLHGLVAFLNSELAKLR
jgi:octaprenyl-diphosphate synthase